MRVRNAHRRTIGSPERLGALLDALASDEDRLWPGDRWPRLRLDGPLEVGARGGHGPVRYRVELYEPSRRVRFRFERPRGFDGMHEFRVVADGQGPAQLAHVLEARMRGAARLSWPLVFRPLHNALIEDALDNAERHVTGQLQRPARWSIFVRALRRLLAFASSRPVRPQDRHEQPHDGRYTMIKLFSLTYVLGATVVIAALGVAYAALTRQPLPLVGSERGALIAVAILGMTACAIGGISQAAGGLVNPSNGLGWTHPMIILGSVLGAVALLILAAGLLGWDGVLQPIAPLLPGTTGAGLSTAHVATFSLAALIALKWLIATAMAIFAQAT